MPKKRSVSDLPESKIPKELERYGRVTLYAGNPERKRRLIQLLELGDGKSLSEMIDIAVTYYLEGKEEAKSGISN